MRVCPKFSCRRRKRISRRGDGVHGLAMHVQYEKATETTIRCTGDMAITIMRKRKRRISIMRGIGESLLGHGQKMVEWTEKVASCLEAIKQAGGINTQKLPLGGAPWKGSLWSSLFWGQSPTRLYLGH